MTEITSIHATKKMKSVIGLDIDEKEIRFAQLAKEKGEIELVSYNSERLPKGIMKEGYIEDEDALTDYIKDFWKKNDLNPKTKVILGVANKDVLIRVTSIEVPPSGDIDRVANEQIQEQIPFEIQDMISDYAVLDETEIEDQVYASCLLIGAKRETMNTFIGPFMKNQINLDDMESSNLALIRMNPYPDKVTIMVDLAYKTGNIVVVERGIPKFFKHIPNDLLLEGAETDELVDYISSVIKQSIQYYESQNIEESVERIVLSGYTVQDVNVVYDIQNKFNIPVEQLNPASKFNNRNNLSKYTLAISLALRGLGD